MKSHWTALNTTEFSYQIWPCPIFLPKPKRADRLMCFRLLRWIFMSLFWLVCRNLMGSYEFVLWWCALTTSFYVMNQKGLKKKGKYFQNFTWFQLDLNKLCMVCVLLLNRIHYCLQRIDYRVWQNVKIALILCRNNFSIIASSGGNVLQEGELTKYVAKIIFRVAYILKNLALTGYCTLSS